MIKLTAGGLILLVAFALFAFIGIQKPHSFDIKKYKELRLVRCSPDLNLIAGMLNESDIPPMPGAGIYKWKISTANDSAQFYFNQGINMYYGFHIIEALASFKKASKFDPENAVLWWAQALAYGPNINDVGYTVSAEALKATKNALAYAGSSTAFEKTLIHAMSRRYAEDSSISREILNQQYADAMQKIYLQFNHPDAAALFADALMLQHPWNFWQPNGTAKTWTPRIRQVLEKALASFPDHPGLNHYYIHVMEASPFAAQALPSAGRLGKLNPGLSHMVHMPSHIYLRTGQYNKAVDINKQALESFEQYSVLFPAVQENIFLYQWHNQHMLVDCAMMAGRYEDAINTSNLFLQYFDSTMLSMPAPLGYAVQYVASSSIFIDLHFSKWQELLKLPTPASSNVYSSILYHFGKGMAHAYLHEIAKAKTELADLEKYLGDKDLTIPFGPFSPPLEGARVAKQLLSGTIAINNQQLNDAIMYFKNAVATEENMIYNEPRDWLLNPKQYLGRAYLKAEQWANAENIFKKDLNQNGQNVWSLWGLLQALKAQQKTLEANIINSQWKVAVSKGDSEAVAKFFE